ncbi:hypothetical protein GCG54_00002879 [Colletotrichum gloeosporioides]|uniref:Fungal N-terminal domain-containing protein n=1 Tax=Colletotrichum gloeosporioides TaxID=474922 RepID=A0A8H4FKD6_COLGL|nr:uncharacterized protein GCG54_00002879 [Colletotrichum gloeosporioides]KAF3805533.1 hypothetical protein GCG54_00002879 [Colletotrichum gloeosporioides]
MDPISIAATAASLAGAAGSTAIVLIRLAKKVKNVDIKLSDAFEEVQKLSVLLVSVDKTVRQCQTHVPSLSHFYHNIWGHFGDTLADCKSNIAGIDQLLRKLSVHFDAEGNPLAKTSQKNKLLFHPKYPQGRDSRLQGQDPQFELGYSDEFAAGDHRLFQELNKLKGSIKKSLRKAHRELPGSETEKKMEIAARNVPFIHFDMFDGEIDERKHPYETTDQHRGMQASGRPDQDENPSSRIAEDNCGNMNQALGFSQTSFGLLSLPPRLESLKKHAASRFFNSATN